MSTLINLGSDLALARTMLEETTRSSYQLIWQEVKGRFPVSRLLSAKKTESNRTKPAKAKVEVRKSNSPPTGPRPWNSRHPFFKRKRGEEIAAAFINKNAPWGIDNVLRKPGCDEIWDMIVKCYDAGFIRDSRYYPNGDHDACSLRLLFPNTP